MKSEEERRKRLRRDEQLRNKDLGKEILVKEIMKMYGERKKRLRKHEKLREKEIKKLRDNENLVEKEKKAWK